MHDALPAPPAPPAPSTGRTVAVEGQVRSLTYGGAVNAALRRALAQWPETLLFGEDVAVPGGVFGVTRGLRTEFGDRVFDTPISESAILGSALGAAMMGRRPLVEIMWADFLLVALDQVVNQIANARYVSGGLVRPSIVIRTQQGNAPGACAQHSQSLEAFLLHTPGLRVVMPTTPQDAHDAVLAAVASDDPVVVVENRTLYAGNKAEVVLGGPVPALGGSRLRRRGDDVTVVAWGAVTRTVETAAEAVAGEGLSVEVLETPWLNPFDTEAVLASVGRTRRLLVVHEANRTGGFGAEVVARVVEAGVPLLAPPARVGAADTRIPAAPALAAAVLPSVDGVAAALRAVCR